MIDFLASAQATRCDRNMQKGTRLEFPFFGTPSGVYAYRLRRSAGRRELSAARLTPSLQNGPPDRSALRSGPFGFSPLMLVILTRKKTPTFVEVFFTLVHHQGFEPWTPPRETLKKGGFQHRPSRVSPKVSSMIIRASIRTEF